MKKLLKCISHRKKFRRNPCKKYKVKFRIYPTFLYCFLDKWLKSMSLKGWHIVDCGIFLFVFEKGEPIEKEYFTYRLSTQEGKYDIALRYPFLEKTYGVENKKSQINSNESKAYQIIEIDINKIDYKNDIGYRELIRDRNRLYLLYFFRNLSILLIASVVLIVSFMLM